MTVILFVISIQSLIKNSAGAPATHTMFCLFLAFVLIEKVNIVC